MTHGNVGSDDAIEISVLDIGHGNTTIVRDGDAVGMIDCSRNNVVYDELERTGTKHLQHLIVSHSDNDHMHGVMRLMARGITVDLVSANADSAKDSVAWKDFRVVVEEQILAGKTLLSAIHVGSAVPLAVGRMKIEALHPDASLVLHGPTRGASRHEGAVDGNDCSAVLRISVKGQPVALLAGDVTRYGFDRMVARKQLLKAPLLVFPHHGGHSGGAAEDRLFARELCEAVRPEFIIFSHGRRSGYGTPRTEIIEGVRDYSNSVKVLCTQLGMGCDNRDVVPQPRHLARRPSDGIRRGGACAGTVVFTISPDGRIAMAPNFADHRSFVLSDVDRGLCTR